MLYSCSGVAYATRPTKDRRRCQLAALISTAPQHGVATLPPS